MTYKIVFENNHFIVVDKSPNVLSVPSRQGFKDNRPCLGILLEVDLNKKIFPVHRLDYEVQGLILFAFTPEAHKAGNAWFEKKSIIKTYSALTQSLKTGPTEFNCEEELVWKCKLLRGKKRAYEADHGKESLTKARLIRFDNDGIFHWELEPITGRSHQLRYELFRHHHPILGDSLYGSSGVFQQEGIALRAFKIDFSKIEEREKFNLPEIIISESL